MNRIKAKWSKNACMSLTILYWVTINAPNHQSQLVYKFTLLSYFEFL